MSRRSVLAQRDLSLLAAASLVSVLGDTAALVALTLRLHADGRSGWLVAALLFAGSVPMVVLSPAAGALADRLDSRVAIAGSALAQAACALALAEVHGTAATLALVTLLTSCGTLVGPATSALVPRTVPPERLVDATAVMQSSFVLGNLAGPIVGGVLTGVLGSRAPLRLDALSFVAVAAAITAVRTRRRPGREESAPAPGGGLRIVAGDPLLRSVVGSLAALVLACGAVNVAEVFLVKDALHGSDAVYGLVGAGWMVGMLGGATLTPRFGRAPAALLTTMAAAQAVLAAGLLGAGVAPTWPLAALAFVVGGLGNGVLVVASRTLVVVRVPDAARGRVAGVMSGAVNAASVAAFGAGGVLVSVAGPRWTVTACGLAVLAVGTVFTAAVRTGRLGSVPACPPTTNGSSTPDWPTSTTVVSAPSPAP